MLECRADQEAEHPRGDVQEKVTRGPVQLFQRRTELHQRHHVEPNVYQPAMQKHGSYKSPPLVFIKYRVGMACPQAVHGLAAHSPEDSKTAASRFAGEGHPADAEHQNVGDQQRRSHGSFLLTEESGKFFAQSREGKPQAGTALVAARRADSDQRSACRAEFRTRRLLASAEKSTYCICPFFHAPLPPIRKRQFSSLRPAHRVPIIPKSPRFFSVRRFFRRPGANGQVRRVRQAHRRGVRKVEEQEELRRLWQTGGRRTCAGEKLCKGGSRAGNGKTDRAVFAR